MKNRYDVIIIGKGPAGISASLYLARAKVKVLVLGKDFGALEKAHLIENYYGLEKPISGLDLALRGVEQARGLGVQVETAEVTGVSFSAEQDQMEQDSLLKPLRFEVSTGTEDTYYASSILIAVGRQRKGLKVPGFDEYRGHGISFCAVCDGFFYKGKTIAVVGNGAFAAAEVSHLSHIASEVILFTDGKELEEEAKNLLPNDLTIVTNPIKAILGTSSAQEGGSVSSIQVDDNEFAVQGIFIAIGTAGSSDFAATLGLPLGEGSEADVLVTLDSGATVISGIYSAGDSTGGYMQVAKAVSDGAHAAKAIISELRSK